MVTSQENTLDMNTYDSSMKIIATSHLDDNSRFYWKINEIWNNYIVNNEINILKTYAYEYRFHCDF